MDLHIRVTFPIKNGHCLITHKANIQSNKYLKKKKKLLLGYLNGIDAYTINLEKWCFAVAKTHFS